MTHAQTTPSPRALVVEVVVGTRSDGVFALPRFVTRQPTIRTWAPCVLLPQEPRRGTTAATLKPARSTSCCQQHTSSSSGQAYEPTVVDLDRAVTTHTHLTIGPKQTILEFLMPPPLASCSIYPGLYKCDRLSQWREHSDASRRS
jgi:hypothetical protein